MRALSHSSVDVIEIVHQEGWFRLRYRVFNIFSGGTLEGEHPALAEAHGGRFRVWPSKSVLSICDDFGHALMA
jgi:hypothetical protein